MRAFGEDHTIAILHRRKIRSLRQRYCCATETKGHRDRGQKSQNAQNGQRPAPPLEITDQTRHGGAEQGSDHNTRHYPADGDLTLIRPDQIADQA
jgi:hypothetical protein